MQSTTTYNRGEVILTPFPFTNLRSGKQRPALVVSSTPYNAATNDLIIAPITSQTGSQRFGDHVIVGWHQAGLLKPSIVRAKLATVSRRVVVRALGYMPSADVQGVENNLSLALQL